MGTLREVTLLDLSGNEIDDAALAHLDQFPKLRVLALRATKITDHGMKNFRQLHELRRLDLYQTDVSPKARAELVEQMPGLDLTDPR
jgi:hypothetical protein